MRACGVLDAAGLPTLIVTASSAAPSSCGSSAAVLSQLGMAAASDGEQAAQQLAGDRFCVDPARNGCAVARAGGRSPCRARLPQQRTYDDQVVTANRRAIDSCRALHARRLSGPSCRCNRTAERERVASARHRGRSDRLGGRLTPAAGMVRGEPRRATGRLGSIESTSAAGVGAGRFSTYQRRIHQGSTARLAALPCSDNCAQVRQLSFIATNIQSEAAVEVSE